MANHWTFENSPPDNGKPVYQFLKPHQIQMIDDALCTLGEFGEVRLIVEKGRLRFLVKQTSMDILKGTPGDLPLKK